MNTKSPPDRPYSTQNLNATATEDAPTREFRVQSLFIGLSITKGNLPENKVPEEITALSIVSSRGIILIAARARERERKRQREGKHGRRHHYQK